MDDGFLYPEINHEVCIHCDKCLEVCPFHQTDRSLRECQSLNCFYGWHHNEDTRAQSTSGGAFSALAELFLERENSFVYGALYDEKWHVRHKGIHSQDDLDKLRQSKYIQSDLGNSYREIKEKLKEHSHVLFCGTPCQVDGLRLFLGKEKEFANLLLLEFICHGVTSPVMFQSYIRHIEKKNSARVSMFRFRDKVKVGNILSLGHTTIMFENGKKHTSECNLYLRGYIRGLMHRESCEKCPYASPYRRADITIGDFWGAEDAIPMLKSETSKGISLILANTKKGNFACDKLVNRMHLVPTKLSYAFNKRNEQLSNPVAAYSNKKRLQNDVNRFGAPVALARALGAGYLISMFYGWVIMRIKGYLPSRLYKAMVSIKRNLTP